jgi:hypothetical protein
MPIKLKCFEFFIRQSRSSKHKDCIACTVQKGYLGFLTSYGEKTQYFKTQEELAAYLAKKTPELLAWAGLAVVA